jgi:hypothetical protein
VIDPRWAKLAAMLPSEPNGQNPEKPGGAE